MSGHERYPDSLIRKILNETKTIAMVGASANESRPSYFAFKYLLQRGYRLFPVNPGLAGKALLGQRVYADLAEIGEPIDMVDIFRSSDAAGPIVDAALELSPLPKVIWMQLGVRNEEAAEKAEAAGCTVIMNRCPKIEFGRMSGEIGWAGVNSRVMSSKKPTLAQGFQKFGVTKD